jgi:hypothetical protein
MDPSGLEVLISYVASGIPAIAWKNAVDVKALVGNFPR